MLNLLPLEHHVWPRPRPREGSASGSGRTCRGQSLLQVLSQGGSLGQGGRAEAQRPRGTRPQPRGSSPRTSRRHSHWASPSKLVALQT